MSIAPCITLPVQEHLQRVPDARSAFCPRVLPVRAVGAAALHRACHGFHGVRRHPAPGHDRHAHLGLHPLLGQIPGGGHRNRPSSRRGAGAGKEKGRVMTNAFTASVIHSSNISKTVILQRCVENVRPNPAFPFDILTLWIGRLDAFISGRSSLFIRFCYLLQYLFCVIHIYQSTSFYLFHVIANFSMVVQNSVPSVWSFESSKYGELLMVAVFFSCYEWLELFKSSPWRSRCGWHRLVRACLSVFPPSLGDAHGLTVIFQATVVLNKSRGTAVVLNKKSS